MKKIALVFSLVFCLCLFAGCKKSNEPSDVNVWNNVSEETNLETNVDVNTETDTNEIQETNWWIITTLYKDWWKLTCDMETTDSTLWEIFATLYVDGDKSFIKSEFTADGQDMSMYVLNRDGKTYTWWDMYWEWFGFVMDAEESVESQISSYDAESESIKMDCKSSVEWNVFDIPSDIDFSDLNNLYQ